MNKRMLSKVRGIRIEQMISSNGSAVANQFVIWIPGVGRIFRSYYSNIVVITESGDVYLDENKWDYSVTTGSYRNQFLCETIKETRKKIKSGSYKLVNLN